MKPSAKFEVNITGTHAVVIPHEHAQPFLDAGQTRVALTAFYQEKSLCFHGKLHERNGQITISFGKRYQKQLGVSSQDHFELQIEEDTSKYGVIMPEAFEAVLATDVAAFDFFEALTMGKKRSLIYYIDRFKSTQTQVDKSLVICENLKRSITDVKKLIKQ